MMMKSKNKKKRLVHFVKKMVVDFLTAQTRGHFYEMNQAPTFMNDFRCNHAWLSRIATNNKWNTSISEAQKAKRFRGMELFRTLPVLEATKDFSSQILVSLKYYIRVARLGLRFSH